MRLRYAEVKNFRSVADLKIDFTTRCRILVGINESGKTNILRALALLSSSRKPEPEDLRDFLPDEVHTQEAYVRFVFALDKAERRQILATLTPVVLTAESNAAIISRDSRNLSLAEFCDSRNEGLYQIDVRTGNRTCLHWALQDSYTAVSGWYKPSATCPADFPITKPDGKTVPLRTFKLIHESAVREKPQDTHLVHLTPNDLNSIVGQAIIMHITANLPDCLYWSYSDSQLLPAQIALDGFAVNPSSCEPLKQMFVLAGIDPIAPAILDAKNRPHGVRNLLNKVATRTTKHLRAVWKDYRGITIALEPNGPNIDASVRDMHNVFQFAKRSDGFKRFVTFLLMVSAKARTEQLSDTLYLQDEPDTGLHPSGSRYLRDELIHISGTNYVVFSTHSIFMIDREQVNRHLIVEKKGEVTRVREVDASNITDEEVIYNALGYSLFENLRLKNLVFEGYKDKLLFQTVMTSSSPKASAIKKKLGGVGVCHARGVKDIARITPLLELAGRQWIVVSDSDKVAREHQKNYEGTGPWLRYDELLPGTKAITGEDFLKPEAFRSAVKAIEAEYSCLPSFNLGWFTGAEPTLVVLRRWLQDQAVSPELAKEALERIKDLVFADLRFSHITDEYLSLLGGLAKRVEELAPRPNGHANNNG